MNKANAKTNCADKMARFGKGQLYEPESVVMSERVAAKANELSENSIVTVDGVPTMKHIEDEILARSQTFSRSQHINQSIECCKIFNTIIIQF